MVKRILQHKLKSYYIKDLSKDYHTEYGFVTKENLNKDSGSLVTSNTGKEFSVFDAFFIDKYKKIKRGPQIIPLKDVGAIIAECGLGRDSVVLDSGSGSGGLCLFLANFVKKVYTFDIKPEHHEIVKQNIEYLGLKNIVAKLHDVYESIPKKDIDTIIFDLPDPWLAIDNASKSLKVGGFLVSYSPTIPQTQDFCNAIHKHEDFILLKVIEPIQREWEVQDRKVRPKSNSMHSGFLAICRKIK